MFASVDVGASVTGCAVATGAGQIIAKRGHSHPRSQGAGNVRVTRVAAAVNEMAADAHQRLLALGLGVPGLADFHRGRTLFLPNLPTQWRNLPVAEQISNKLGCPVFVLNDSRMAALANSGSAMAARPAPWWFSRLGRGSAAVW